MGSKYARIHNIVGLEFGRVTQDSKYAAIWLNMSEQDVNMPEYVCILQMTNKRNTMYTIKIALLIISMLIDVKFQKKLAKNDNTKIKF